MWNNVPSALVQNPVTEFDLRSPIVVGALSVWEFLDYNPSLSLSQNFSKTYED